MITITFIYSLSSHPPGIKSKSWQSPALSGITAIYGSPQFILASKVDTKFLFLSADSHVLDNDSIPQTSPQN